MKEGDIWLAEHFLVSGIEILEKMEKGALKNRLESEISCLLAFLTRDNSESLGKTDK
jgi:hypothetical protein